MFFRMVRVRGSSGTIHEYVRLVESIRENGKPRQRVVATLGRRDVLDPLLPQLVEFLKGTSGVRKLFPETSGLEPLDSSTWGPVLVARTLFEELGLWSILDKPPSRPGRRVRDEGAFADRVLALVANRLSEPTSEHGLARWLETYFVCDRQGRRFQPQWKTRRRVRVDFAQLQQWYRTLDRLLEHKAEIERALYLRLRDLFSLEPDLVFYDLTSTYFEGRGPAGLARHGYSRDGKPRNRQVLVGVVMVNGWPIAHHVFNGNLRDSVTVPHVLDDLKGRFQFKRVVFVGDRGMLTTENVERVREGKQGYLMGMPRRRRKEVMDLIERATGPWIDCPVGITASEKSEVPRTRVQEVPSGRPGVRVFVVDSDERREYERGEREKAMERTRGRLERLAARVSSGRLLKPEKIGAAAARALSQNHGHRYYDWKLVDGVFQFFEHPVHFKQELAYEGKYLVETEEPHLTAVEAVQRYKELSDVERAFRHLKNLLGLRPIHHQRPDRVQAHIFVAALAFLLDRFIERRLKKAGVNLSSTEALQALQTVRHVTCRIGGEDIRRGVTPGTPRAQQALKALGITDRLPPKPPTGQESRV